MAHIGLMLPLFFIIGIFAGMVAMVYGIGGGIILVPFIYIYLSHIGFDTATAMKVAAGTSLLNVFIGTFMTARRQYKAKKIVFPVLIRLAPAVIIGVFLGLSFSHFLKGAWLRELFIVFLIGVILNGFLNKKFKTVRAEHEFKMPSFTQLTGTGILIGALSVLVGIGGGVLIIPYLRHHKMTMVQTSATSASIASIIALCGSLGYVYLGLHAENVARPPYTLGYVNILIFFGIQLGIFLGIHLGGKISKKMNDQSRAKWFPVLLSAMVLLMLA